LTEFLCLYIFGIEFAFPYNKKTPAIMKKLLALLILLSLFSFDTYNDNAYGAGEWFKFRIHYGFVNAGYATLEVKDIVYGDKKSFHVVGKGYTTGMSRFFFKVDDLYETFIEKESNKPLKFVRNIYEGGYTKSEEGFFNTTYNKVLVKDLESKTDKTLTVPNNTQDILSAFYYFRNYPNIDKLKVGETATIDMFFDNETTKFRLKFLGREDINTKFGVISTLIFRPLVQSGRVFKEQESLTMWVSDDANRLPIRIKAELAVGSIKADLDGYKGLIHPFSAKK
jgi:hypothetical protein